MKNRLPLLYLTAFMTYYVAKKFVAKVVLLPLVL